MKNNKKNLKDNEKILDFMRSEELAANLFRITQTEAKLERKNVKNCIDKHSTLS